MDKIQGSPTSDKAKFEQRERKRGGGLFRLSNGILEHLVILFQF